MPAARAGANAGSDLSVPRIQLLQQVREKRREIVCQHATIRQNQKLSCERPGGRSGLALVLRAHKEPSGAIPPDSSRNHEQFPGHAEPRHRKPFDAIRDAGARATPARNRNAG